MKHLKTLLVVFVLFMVTFSCKVEETKTPPVFKSFIATSLSPTSILVSWHITEKDADAIVNIDQKDLFISIVRINTIAKDTVAVTLVNVSTFLDESVQPRTHYIYEGLAHNEDGASNKVSCSVVTPDNEPTTPNAPSDLSISPGFTITALSWIDNSDNETNFYVFRNGNRVGILDENTTAFIDTALSINTEYSYSIVSANEAGQSTMIESNTITWGQFTARWNRAYDDAGAPENGWAAGYLLYDITPGHETLLTDTSDTTYTFYVDHCPTIIVKAYDDADPIHISEPSNEVRHMTCIDD